MAVASRRSTLRMVGGLARENPVPTVFQPVALKAWNISRPSRPVAPVINAVLSIVILGKYPDCGCHTVVGGKYEWLRS